MYQLAKGSLIEEVEMLRGPLQVSEEEFLNDVRVVTALQGAGKTDFRGRIRMREAPRAQCS